MRIVFLFVLFCSPLYAREFAPHTLQAGDWLHDFVFETPETAGVGKPENNGEVKPSPAFETSVFFGDARYLTGGNSARDDGLYQSFSADIGWAFVHHEKPGLEDGNDAIVPSIESFWESCGLGRRGNIKEEHKGHRFGVVGHFRLWGGLLWPVEEPIPVLHRFGLLVVSAGAGAGYVQSENFAGSETKSGARIQYDLTIGIFLAQARISVAEEFYSGDRLDEFEVALTIPKPIIPIGLTAAWRYQHGLTFTMNGWLLGVEVSF